MINSNLVATFLSTNIFHLMIIIDNDKCYYHDANNIPHYDDHVISIIAHH